MIVLHIGLIGVVDEAAIPQDYTMMCLGPFKIIFNKHGAKKFFLIDFWN
jgi:hypothetical protein